MHHITDIELGYSSVDSLGQESLDHSSSVDHPFPPSDASKPKLPRPVNAGKKWTKGDDAELFRLWLERVPLKELAARIGRTEFAVVNRFWLISGPIATVVSGALSGQASR